MNPFAASVPSIRLSRFVIIAMRKRAAGMACALTLVFVSLLWPSHVVAQAVGDRAPLAFVSSAEEQRFHTLVAELRCVMCQNQSLADSDAQIAKDLRREVLKLMREGRSDDDIRDFLVARYGEFVLYRPRISGSTWLLWFGPLAFVLAGGIVAIRLSRKGASTKRDVATVPEDDAQEW